MTQKTRLNRRRARKGFTLLEIMLVVGLLALLASFAVPAFINSGEKAKVKMAEAALGPNGTLSQAMDLFKFATGVYPEGLIDLVERPKDDEIAEKWAGPYIKDTVMLKDPWDSDFGYENPGKQNENGVDMWSNGPDKVSGNEDDIVNWKTDR